MCIRDSSLDQLSKSADAAVNVVVSSVGLRAAKVLQRKFGTPYVIGAPVGRFTEKLSEAMEAAVSGEKEDNVVYAACRMSAENLQDVNDAKESPSHRVEMTLIGEPVTMGSLAAAIEPVSYTHLDVYKRQVWMYNTVPSDRR